MIYASLKPVQRWANGYVLPNYLLLGCGERRHLAGADHRHALPAYFGTSSRRLAAIIGSALAALGKSPIGASSTGAAASRRRKAPRDWAPIGKVRLFARRTPRRTIC
jgi:hypothetical protein